MKEAAVWVGCFARNNRVVFEFIFRLQNLRTNPCSPPGVRTGVLNLTGGRVKGRGNAREQERGYELPPFLYEHLFDFILVKISGDVK